MTRRIALISEHASPLAAAGGVDSGGQNIYVAHVALQLSRLGFHVDVFTRRDHARLAPVVEWAPGVRVVHVGAGPERFVRKEELLGLMPQFAARVRDFARDEGGYDVCHANFFMSGLVGMELRRSLGVPLIVTLHALGRVRQLHQGGADEFPPQRVAIEEAVIAAADAVIAECPQDWSDLVQLYGADPDRLRLIPCGFDRAEFWPVGKALARRTLGIPADMRVLLNIGRVVPRKGLDNAVRGLGRLVHEQGVPARLLIVGGNSDIPCPEATPEIARLQALAEAEGVGGDVTFTGRRSREFLKFYYSAADLFVTTPWYEPFGITPLESMACGTPVVGSDVGGIRYSIVDRVTGALVPPNDPGMLAARAAEMLADPERLKEMGRNGMRRVNAHFTWSKVARSIAGVYQEFTVHRRRERRSVAVAA